MNVEQAHYQVRNKPDKSSDRINSEESSVLANLAKTETTRGNDHAMTTKKRRCATNLTSSLTGTKTMKAVH